MGKKENRYGDYRKVYHSGILLELISLPLVL